MATLVLPAHIELNSDCTICDSILEVLKLHIKQAHAKECDKSEKSCNKVSSPLVEKCKPEVDKTTCDNSSSPQLITNTESTFENHNQVVKCDSCDKTFPSKKLRNEHAKLAHKGMKIRELAMNVSGAAKNSFHPIS